MGIKIDKNVPIPARPTGAGQTKYPWHEMEVGDSFYVECERYKIHSAMSQMNARLKPKHFISRSENKGARVWRDK